MKIMQHVIVQTMHYSLHHSGMDRFLSKAHATDLVHMIPQVLVAGQPILNWLSCLLGSCSGSIWRQQNESDITGGVANDPAEIRWLFLCEFSELPAKRLTTLAQAQTNSRYPIVIKGMISALKFHFLLSLCQASSRMHGIFCKWY